MDPIANEYIDRLTRKLKEAWRERSAARAEALTAQASLRRVERELEEARERERALREALCRALDRGFPGDTHEGDCAVTRGMQCDCWIGQARALASTPPDMEGGEAEPPAHPVRMAQPDEEMAL